MKNFKDEPKKIFISYSYNSNDNYKKIKYFLKHLEIGDLNWIETICLKTYKFILQVKNWKKNINMLIVHIHRAFELFLKKQCNKLGIKFKENNCNIEVLYEKIMTNQNKNYSPIKDEDYGIVSILRKTRNNYSVAHTNKVPSLTEDEGMNLVKKLSKIVIKINKN